jgi:hypothetical protein|uniref:hypothetical protein n=1 Tax=unclassified Variovorax TaxID=663243 RepID=UPI00104ED0EF
MKRLALALLLAAVAATACGDHRDSSPVKRSGELATKREYSVLQGVEAQERSRLHASTPLIRKNALNSEYDAIGLPSKGRDHGYVWIIANSDTLPEVKLLPEDASFSVTASQLTEISKRVVLSKEVQDYLVAHTTR